MTNASVEKNLTSPNTVPINCLHDFHLKCDNQAVLRHIPRIPHVPQAPLSKSTRGNSLLRIDVAATFTWSMVASTLARSTGVWTAFPFGSRLHTSMISGKWTHEVFIARCIHIELSLSDVFSLRSVAGFEINQTHNAGILHRNEVNTAVHEKSILRRELHRLF